MNVCHLGKGDLESLDKIVKGELRQVMRDYIQKGKKVEKGQRALKMSTKSEE